MTSPTMLFTASEADLTQVTKEFILDRVDERAIMERYLGLSVKMGMQYKNPLRKDKNPTCVFSYYQGRLYFRDWALWPRGKDCFDIVMLRYNCSYATALNTVATDFGVLALERDPFLQERKLQLIKEEGESSSKSLIQIKPQNFTVTDVEYLKSFGITKDICKKYEVCSVKYVHLNGRLKHVYTPHDPALAYYFGESENGEERWKIYFYKRRKGNPNPRFYCNTNRLAGWTQIPKEGMGLVITKSLKDVMVLDRFGIPAISMQNETTEPYEWIIQQLQQRYDNLYSLYDFDYTGVRMANKLKRLYNITPIFLTDGRQGTFNWGAKDISDHVRDHGLKATQQIIDRARRTYGV